MDKFNSKKSNDDSKEESSDEDEQDPNENNQSTPPAELSSMKAPYLRFRQTNVIRQDIRVILSEDENQLLIWFWLCCLLILMQLVVYPIILGWQWLTLIFVGISICIFGCSNRNGDYQPAHIFMVIFILLAIILMIIHIPTDINNAQTPDENLSVNNENAQPYDDFNGDTTNPFAHDEPASQFIVRASEVSEAVDNSSYNINSLALINIPNDTYGNNDSDEENRITFSPSIHPRVFQGDDDNMRNYNDSGNEYGSAVSEPSFNLNVEDEQIDERYLIFNTTDNTIHEVDSINENAAINTDDGYGTITETDALIDDEQDTLIEIQNNAPIDEEVSTIELSISLLLTGNMNPLVLADIEIPTDSNADHHEGSEQSDGRNNDVVRNNNQRGRVSPSSDTSVNYGQNNEQSDQISSTEADDEEIRFYIRETSMELQKQPNPLVDFNENSSKQNLE